MSVGRTDVWPDTIRSAVIAGVLDDDRPLMRVLRDLAAGILGELEAVDVPYATARRWIDRERMHRARNVRPDIAAYNAAAERFWRLANRELDKAEREARGKKPLDPKRLRELGAVIREARPMVVPPKSQQSDTPDQPEGSGERATSDDIAARLAREDPSPQSATDSPTPAPRETGKARAKAATTSSNGNGGSRSSAVLADDGAAQPRVAQA